MGTGKHTPQHCAMLSSALSGGRANARRRRDFVATLVMQAVTGASSISTESPHPEEHRVAMRLVARSNLRAEVGNLPYRCPPFETRTSCAPQGEVVLSKRNSL